MPHGSIQNWGQAAWETESGQATKFLDWYRAAVSSTGHSVPGETFLGVMIEGWKRGAPGGWRAGCRCPTTQDHLAHCAEARRHWHSLHTECFCKLTCNVTPAPTPPSLRRPYCLQIWAHTETPQEEISPAGKEPSPSGGSHEECHSSPAVLGSKVLRTKAALAARSTACPHCPRTQGSTTVQAPTLSKRRLKRESLSQIWVGFRRFLHSKSQQENTNSHAPPLVRRGLPHLGLASHEPDRVEGSFQLSHPEL